MAENKKRKRKRIRKSRAQCEFCVTNTTPDYKEYKVLKNYVTDRGKMIARSRTGVCQKHQRLLSSAIKRARNLALLPYVTVLK